MAVVTKDALLGLLAHENTRQALGRLAQGEDVRRVAADVAGQALAAKIGQMLGAAPAPKVVDVGAPVAGVDRSARPARPEPIDAEFVTINVKPA